MMKILIAFFCLAVSFHSFAKQKETDYEILGTCLTFLNYKSKNSILSNSRETSFFNKYHKLQTPQMMEAISKSQISC